MARSDSVELDCSILLQDKYYEQVARRRRTIDKWVRSYWGDALDMLLALTGQLTVWGDKLLNGVPASKKNSGPVFVQQLVRLHTSACRVADGITVLLAAGHADEAMGRWRTLFEHSVILRVLSRGDEALSIRYYDHHAKASIRAQEDYRRYYKRLGAAAPDRAEEEKAAGFFDKRKKLYGSHFSSDYGWAGKNRRFFDLAEEVGLDYLMPYYGMASYNVHADAKSLMTKLGSHDSSIALGGPSLLGLADPGHCTAISLTHVFETVLDNCVALSDRERLMGMVLRYCDTVGDRFLVAHKQLETDRTSGNIHPFENE